MKCFRCLCCLCLCCVLSLTVFSLNVNAKGLEIPTYSVTQKNELKANQTNQLFKEGYYKFYPNTENQYFYEDNSFFAVSNGEFRFDTSYEIYSDGKVLIDKGANANVQFNNIYYSYLLTTSSGSRYARNITSKKVLISYANGSYEYINNVTTRSNGPIQYVSFNFVPSDDVLAIKVMFEQVFNVNNVATQISAYYGEIGDTINGYKLSVSQDSEETTELKGIKGWIQNIFNSITELPSKLWNIISDGLKNLFLPSAEFIAQFKEDLDLMLEEKLGAVYQVVDITINSWDKIKDSDETNTINFPKTSINLLGGEEFSFGGYDVKIVPSGFEFLVESIKLVCGIVCTLLFVNGLRKRYDEVMGVEQ